MCLFEVVLIGYLKWFPFVYVNFKLEYVLICYKPFNVTDHSKTKVEVSITDSTKTLSLHLFMRNNNAEVTFLLAREINSKENAILSLSLSHS